MTELYLCAQCAKQVIWPKELKKAEEQPCMKQPCKLCGRPCYGFLYQYQAKKKEVPHD